MQSLSLIHISKTGANAYDIALYMNFQDYQQYRNLSLIHIYTRHAFGAPGIFC